MDLSHSSSDPRPPSHAHEEGRAVINQTLGNRRLFVVHTTFRPARDIQRICEASPAFALGPRDLPTLRFLCIQPSVLYGVLLFIIISSWLFSFLFWATHVSYILRYLLNAQDPILGCSNTLEAIIPGKVPVWISLSLLTRPALLSGDQPTISPALKDPASPPATPALEPVASVNSNQHGHP